MLVVKQLNPGDVFTYLVYDGKARKAVMADPLAEKIRDYMDVIEDKKLVLAATLSTRSDDAAGEGARLLSKQMGCEFIVHVSSRREDATLRIGDGRVLLADGIPADVVRLPGSGEGSMCIVLDGAMLGGDSFPLNRGSPHIKAIVDILGRLPRGHLVLPSMAGPGGQRGPRTLALHLEGIRGHE